MNRSFDTRKLAFAGMIAALYAVVTLLLRPISYGEMQVRVSEALTLLPILTPAAVPGLFVGCLIANVLGSATIWDMVFGSLATLIAALITRRLRRKPALAALAPVVMNGLVVGLVLHFTLNLPLLATMMWVALGEAVACYALGLPLLWALKKLPEKYFPQ
jgi:uncharacterized membrane protein